MPVERGRLCPFDLDTHDGPIEGFGREQSPKATPG